LINHLCWIETSRPSSLLFSLPLPSDKGGDPRRGAGLSKSFFLPTPLLTDPFSHCFFLPSHRVLSPFSLLRSLTQTMLFDALLGKLEKDMRVDLERAITGFVATARTQLEGALAMVAKERAKGLVEVAKEKADLHREIAAMHTHREAQEGRVVLDIGGYRYTTSVQTLRRLPHTFFDAYFSGRYAQDVCNDGSIFVDRDGEHFGQVLEYMRDGVVSVAEPGAQPSMSLLRLLKREFGFYCIELMAEPQEVAFAVAGVDDGEQAMASVERYNIVSGAWQAAAPMLLVRAAFGLCEVAGELYVTGGVGTGDSPLASVERYDPSLDTWSAAPALPDPRFAHCACAVGDAMFLLGGIEGIDNLIPVSSVLRFDSRVQTWSEMAPMPAKRDNAGACVVGNNIFVFGGCDDDKIATSTTYCFSTETDTWATLAPMPKAMCSQRVCALEGLIYVMGGRDSEGVVRTSVHRFDPVADSWSAMASMSVVRSGFEAFVLDGGIHAVGGFDGESRVTSMERYCVVSDSWSEVSGRELGQSRTFFGAHTMRVTMNLFDSLIANA
jgi:hypothetical protein